MVSPTQLPPNFDFEMERRTLHWFVLDMYWCAQAVMVDDGWLPACTHLAGVGALCPSQRIYAYWNYQRGYLRTSSPFRP